MFYTNPESFFYNDYFDNPLNQNENNSFSLFDNNNYVPLGTSFHLEFNSQEEYNNIFVLPSQLPIKNEIENDTPPNQENNSELKNKKRVHPKTKSTDYKTSAEIIITNKKKEIIFEIKKVKTGRKRKNKIIIKDKTHTKFKKDNIIIKIKRNLYNHSLKFVNALLKNSNDNKINKIKLRKNDNSIIIASKKEKNLSLLKTPIKDILSTKLSSKYIYLHEDYNKDKINFIIKQNNKEINEFLNKTFEDILNLYRKDKDDNDIYKDFKRLNDDIEKYKMENEDENYINLYKEVTNDFKTVIARIFPRKERKK